MKISNKYDLCENISNHQALAGKTLVILIAHYMTYKLADYKNNIKTSKVSYGLISKFYLDVITITIFSTVDSIHDFSKKGGPSHDHQISLFLNKFWKQGSLLWFLSAYIYTRLEKVNQQRADEGERSLNLIVIFFFRQSRLVKARNSTLPLSRNVDSTLSYSIHLKSKFNILQ